MEFLLDQGLPRSTVQHLQALGLEAEHVGDLGLATATDEAILAEGCARGAIVVTLDADFHANLARSGAAQPSVIRIRIQGLKGEDVARVIKQVVRCWWPRRTAYRLPRPNANRRAGKSRRTGQRSGQRNQNGRR